jgi:hypothetical protein
MVFYICKQLIFSVKMKVAIGIHCLSRDRFETDNFIGLLKYKAEMGHSVVLSNGILQVVWLLST